MLRELGSFNIITYAFYFVKYFLQKSGCFVENAAEYDEIILVNPADEKEQIQYFYNDKWWYFEMMPNTSATIKLFKTK